MKAKVLNENIENIKNKKIQKSVLFAKGVGIDFGSIKAVESLDLNVKNGEIFGLIGPNGAGKTTAFNLFTKVYQYTRGEMLINGHDMKAMTPIDANKYGIARTFQNIRLFKSMTVLENVLVGFHNQIKYTTFGALLRSNSYKKFEKQTKEKARNLMNLFGLSEFERSMSQSLSYGHQRKLEIVRALATNPAILLLDEPAAGMNASETQELLNSILKIKELFGTAILLIEHDMNFVMKICDVISVLDYGKLIAHGKPEDIKQNENVIKAYLGTD